MPNTGSALAYARRELNIEANYRIIAFYSFCWKGGTNNGYGRSTCPISTRWSAAAPGPLTGTRVPSAGSYTPVHRLYLPAGRSAGRFTLCVSITHSPGSQPVVGRVQVASA